MKPLSLLLFILLATTSFSQNTIILQPDAAAGKDASIFNLNALANYGSDVDFIASQWEYAGEPGTTRSLIQFDLSSIPNGVYIANATLSLFYNHESSTPGQIGNNAAYLRRLIQPWDENTVAWNQQPFYTTDNEVLIPSSTTPDQDYQSINVTGLVRDMVDNPGNSFGFMFMQQTEQGLKSMKFYSSDGSNPDERPRLEISFAPVSNNDIPQKHASIRPNPFDDSVIIENLEGNYLITISDVNGKQVHTASLESVDGQLEIRNLSFLPRGIYFINANGETGIYFSKAIKE